MRNQDKMAKNGENDKLCTHGVCHGADHDMADMVPPKHKEKSKGTIQPTLQPTFYRLCMHGVRHEAMASAMGFEA